MQDRHEVVLEANITKFKQKMKEAETISKQTGQKIAQNAKYGIWEDGKYKLNGLTYVKKDASELNQQLKDTSGKSNEVGKSMTNAFDKGLKSIKKLTLGFLGARSAFSLFRKYLSEYQSQNEDFANKMQLTTNIIVNTLAPAFEIFGNVIQYASIGLARIIEMLTGTNILAKTVSNGFKDASKSAKEFNDNLSGLDEISNISEDSGGLSTGIQSQINSLNEFQKKIQEVNNWISGFSWENLGKSLSDGINWAVQQIDKIDWDKVRETIKSVITNIDWGELGKVAFHTLWEAFKTSVVYQTLTINTVFDEMFEELKKYFGIQGDSLGSKLVDGIKTGVKTVIKIGNPLYAIGDFVYSLFKKADGGIFTGNSWQPITAYAGGGGPSTGEMFVAREAGPEMVGTIGGHTAVMNNDQIVASVSAGVYEAVLSAMGGQNDRPIVLNINGKEFAKATYNDYQEETYRRGTNTAIRRM